MASAAMPGMTVLPQFQGSAYQLQQQQALAQALMQQSFQPQNTQAVGSGQYSIVPKYSAVGGLAQLGQALMAAKMQNNVAQGYNQLGQNQWSVLTGQPPQTPQAAAPQQTTDAGGMTDNQSGPSVTSAPVPTPGQPTPQAYASALGSTGAPQQSAAPQQGGGLLSPGGPLNPNGIPVNAAATMFMTPEGQKELFKSVAASYAPTDTTRMGRQAGYTPEQIQQANSGRIFKDNFVAPVTGTGIFRSPQTMQPIANNPNMPAGTNPLFDASGNVAAVQPIQGAQSAMQGNAAATAAGEGSQLPYAGVDASGNPLPVTNRTAAATQAGATTPASAAIVQTESGGSPNAVSPKGAMGAWQVMPNTNANPGFGVKPAQNNSPAELNRVGQDYYNAMTQRYQSPTLGAIAYNMGPGATDQWIKNGAKFESLPAETRNYVGKVATLTALNSGAGTPPSGGGTPAGGAVYAAPPMGAQANAEETVKGQIDTMQKSYQNLQTVRSGAPAALQDVDNMSKLAQGANPLTVGPAGAKFAGLFSANAAEYEKSRDNLVTNLGSQLGINSDAARDLVYGSIPSYGAPKQAVQNGLDTLRGQIQTRLLKSDYLSGAYTSGDAKAYNQKENQFDQNMTPAVANQVSTFNSMPTGPAKAQALKAAASNPQLRSRLEWAVSNGILK
jgi:soluble lytic murein transglycosylase-like protein